MHRRLLVVSVALMFLFCLAGASAFPASHDASRFVEERWTAQSGLTGGHVRAITQTPDGYLWIATDAGLLRFDGFSFRSVPFSPTTDLANNAILGLTTDDRGNLLIRLQGSVVLRHANGDFERLASAPGSTTSYVTAMSRSKSGEVLLWDLMSGLLRFKDGHLGVIASRRGSRGLIVISIAQSPDSKIWLGSLVVGVFSEGSGGFTSEKDTIRGTKASCLLPLGDQQLLVGTDKGLYRWDGITLHQLALSGRLGNTQILALLQDHRGDVWVGTARGLFRINVDGGPLSEEAEFDLGVVNAIYEDREGNIWAGGADGLERVRESTFETYPIADDQGAAQDGPVYVDRQARGWYATQAGRLYLLTQGRVQQIKSPVPHKDIIYTIAGRNDDIWLGTQHEGLTHFRYDHGLVNVRTYTHADGLAEDSVYSSYVAQDGSVWAGTLTSGVSRLKDNQFVTYTTANGLASNTVSSILQTQDGIMRFGTSNGLSSLSGGEWTNDGVNEGLPSGEVICLLQDSSGTLWIGTSAGLAFLNSGHIHALLQTPPSLRGPIVGLAEDRKGWLWIATTSHVLRVPRAALIAGDGVVSSGEVREYGVNEGLTSTNVVTRNHSVVSGPDGRVWVSSENGPSVVDPAQIGDTSAPALAHIEAITADGVPVELADSVRIPPSRKRITFAYTGLSLAEPGRIRFRYYLEGFDHGWSEPVAAREVAYTNIGPGKYRFHLIASNDEALWNAPEASTAMQVEPALWQTWWFRALCSSILVLGTVLLYLTRVQRLERQLNIRFEERLAERLRIARDLHDTLLQGVQGLTLRFNSAMQGVPPGTATRGSLEEALETADQVLLEARNQVMRLRSEHFEHMDLARSLEKVGVDLNRHRHLEFSLLEKGSVSAVQPMVAEELFFIGREAITNAFLHAMPSVVTVEISYGRAVLRLSCRDNGVGMEPDACAGKATDGHWGLVGMRERSEKVGGELNIHSRLGAGTEILVTVPARRAYLRRGLLLGALLDRVTRNYPGRSERSSR